MSHNSEGEGRQGAGQDNVRPNGAATGATQGAQGQAAGGRGAWGC
jgi:hypothetical protein